MNKEKIKKLMSLGYTDGEIKDIIDKGIIPTIDIYDTGDVNDNIQDTLKRTWNTIDKTLEKIIINEKNISDNKYQSDNNEADIAELNLGKFDVNGDGTKITEIFDANGDLNQSAVTHVTHSTNEAFKGEFDKVGALPPTGNIEGDYAFVGSTGSWIEYSWTGSAWEEIGNGPSGGGAAIDEKRLWRAGKSYQMSAGIFAGSINQGASSIAIGVNSGKTNQGAHSTAIGNSAGFDHQGANSTVIGYGAGSRNAPKDSISIGYDIASSEEGGVKIGSINYPLNNFEVKGGKAYVGGNEIGAGTSHVSHAANDHFKGEFEKLGALPPTGNTLGDYAFVGTGDSVIVYDWIDSTDDGVGDMWATTNVAAPSGGGVAIDEKRLFNLTTGLSAGGSAGTTNQKSTSIALGILSGNTNQGVSPDSDAAHTTGASIAIGYNAGQNAQSGNAVAIGSGAGAASQGGGAVAIGPFAGRNNQNNHSIAIGGSSGLNDLGENSIVIGYQAWGPKAQPKNTILMGTGFGWKDADANIDKEGDIKIITKDTSNGNNNKLEVKDGKLYINGKEVAFV